jgi:hypothetical protein
MRMRADADFLRIEREILEGGRIEKYVESSEGSMSKEEAERLFRSLMSFLEFNFVAEPFRKVVGHLCEQAQDVILMQSVENVEAETQFGDVLRLIWLADLGSEKGVRVLNKTVGDIGFAPFFRVMLVLHVVSRAYWNASSHKHRERLLKVAESSMRGLGLQIDKTKMMRGMEQKNQEDDEQED